MRRLYIRGLVRTADTVRRALSRPLPAEQKEQLRRLVVESLQQVDGILASHGAKLACLPAPTRRAYQFLSSLDFDAVAPQPAAEPGFPSPGTVALVGLKSFWDRMLTTLAQPVPEDRANVLHRSISATSENVERHLSRDGLKPADLTAQSRAARGWLAFFADRKNFDSYVAAVARAAPIIAASFGKSGRFRAPALVQFRPLPGLYRLRGYRDGTRIILPTPMICFSEELFGATAEAALNGGSKQPVMEATFGDEYQGIQAELEALSGVEECTAGVHHDLRASFGRVNGRYFSNSVARPCLTWSRTFTGRKFGHYDPIRDTVMVSSTLDHAQVPAFVVDFIMYHELLHKQLGVGWRNGRQTVHTPEFRAAERMFEQYAAAELALAESARGAAPSHEG